MPRCSASSTWWRAWSSIVLGQLRSPSTSRRLRPASSSAVSTASACSSQEVHPASLPTRASPIPTMAMSSSLTVPCPSVKFYTGRTVPKQQCTQRRADRTADPPGALRERDPAELQPPLKLGDGLGALVGRGVTEHDDTDARVVRRLGGGQLGFHPQGVARHDRRPELGLQPT